MIRRDFLQRLLGAAALLSTASFSRAAPPAFGDGMFRNPVAAAAIGRVYLATNPALDRHALMRDAGLGERARGESMSERVRARSAEDFVRGDTVLVNGWVLSRAEASACALAAYSSPG